MPSARPSPTFKLLDLGPGWICLAGGCLILGLLVLIPSYLKVRTVAWDRDLMALQARRLDEQLDRYQRFTAGLACDDPILIERLAFTELRQKAMDTDVFGAGASILLASQTEILPAPPGSSTPAPGSFPRALGSFTRVTAPDPAGHEQVGQGSRPGGARYTAPGSVEAWLHVPMPVVGRDFAPLGRVQSHLVRVATGPHRVLALLAAAGIIAVGLLIGGSAPATRPAPNAP